MKQMHAYTWLALTLFIPALFSCSEQPSYSNQIDRWREGGPPEVIVESKAKSKWLAVSGISGVIFFINPAAPEGGHVDRKNLDIDCFINAIVDANGEVLVGGTRSRNELDSPSGVYSVDIESGRAKLLFPTEQHSIRIRDIFVVGDAANKQIIICSFDDASYIDLDRNEIIRRHKLPEVINRDWAHLGNGVLCGLLEVNRLVLFDLRSGESSEFNCDFDEISVSDIEGMLVARSGGSWAAWKYNPDGKKPFILAKTIGNYRGYFPFSFSLKDSNEIVLALSFELPPSVDWIVDGSRLTTWKFQISSAIAFSQE